MSLKNVNPMSVKLYVSRSCNIQTIQSMSSSKLLSYFTCYNGRIARSLLKLRFDYFRQKRGESADNHRLCTRRQTAQHISWIFEENEKCLWKVFVRFSKVFVRGNFLPTTDWNFGFPRSLVTSSTCTINIKIQLLEIS